MKKGARTNLGDQVKIATIIKGDYARLLIKLKVKGRIRTYTDGVYRALDLLLDKTTAQNLQLSQAGSLEEEP